MHPQHESRPKRVVFTARGMEDITLNAIRGVMAFSSKAPDWKLLNGPRVPKVDLAEIDLDDVDGVIGFVWRPQWAHEALAAGVPAVNISTFREDIPLPRVANDDEAVGRTGAKHFLERGFTHMGFYGTRRTWLYQRRLDGFRGMVEQARDQPCHVFPIRPGRSAMADAVKNWLLDIPKPIAVLAATDDEARNLVDYASEADLSIPDQVAVLGVDNHRWLTELGDITLSSIELDFKQIGYRAAQALDSLMKGGAVPQDLWVPPIGVVTRQSTDCMVTDEPIVGAALSLMRDHLHEELRIEDLAEKLSVSRRTLETHIKRATGRTPQQAIYLAKVDLAKRLLTTSEMPLQQVSEACGFRQQSRFFLVFKRETGMTPGSYRQRYGVGGGHS